MVVVSEILDPPPQNYALFSIDLHTPSVGFVLSVDFPSLFGESSGYPLSNIWLLDL
jgi:hypothetical protein